MTQLKRPLVLFILCLFHIILGINGLIGGFMLFLKPDGSLLGMQADWLIRSPFKNYLIPGLLLSIFLGMLPLFTSAALLMKNNWRWIIVFNIYLKMHWAWSFSLYTGIIAIFWITFQLLLTQYFWIQPVIIFFGLFIIILTMVPAVIYYFKIDRITDPED